MPNNKWQQIISIFIISSLFISILFINFNQGKAEKFDKSQTYINLSQERNENYASDRVIIKYIDEVDLSNGEIDKLRVINPTLGKLLANQGVENSIPLFGNVIKFNNPDNNRLSKIHVLHLDKTRNVYQVVDALSEDPSIEWAEPDFLAYPTSTIPNDARFSEQWGLDQIQAPAAWDIETGDQTVVIAVVDSGIDISHQDLSPKIWNNPGEVANNGIDDDNNGFIDDVNGWDFVNSDNDPQDDYGHGTQVAGVVSAQSNNSVGIAGVCWGCKLMPVKVMQVSGVANYSDIAAGVLYAAEKGAEVINLSLGGQSDSNTLKSAIQAATDIYGSVVVGGAGNNNLDSPLYPAAYGEVLAVAGTTQSDNKYGLSNYGARVDVSAPAVGISTTFMGGDYGYVDGTSLSAAFASGFAGLLRSHHPTWSQATIRAQIIQSTDNIDSENPSYIGKLGSGRVNANQGLSITGQPLLQIDSKTINGEINGRPEPGSNHELYLTLLNDWLDAENVQALLTSTSPYVTISNGTSAYGDIPTYENISNTAPFKFTLSASTPYSHNLSFNLELTAAGGFKENFPFDLISSPNTVFVHGTINSQTWTNDHIYIVDNEAGVGLGETLIIQPGTEVKFSGNYSLSIEGTLIAKGTEQQPITFTSNQIPPNAGDWGRIRFQDTSVDASFDSQDEYLAGSILQHTVIEFGKGVLLENASPYISNNRFHDLNSDGIQGNISQEIIIEDNEITNFDEFYSGINITGDGYLIKNNNISDADNGIIISGAGLVEGNTISNVKFTGLSANGNTSITANRIYDCQTGVSISQGNLSGNIVAHNADYGIVIGDVATVINNTLINNGEAGVYITGSGYSPILHQNNIISESGVYGLKVGMPAPAVIDATNNWWGTTNPSTIQTMIYDGTDEFGLGTSDASNPLANPDQLAPAYVTDIVVLPDTTVGIQTATLDINFSRPMDTDLPPYVHLDS